MDEDLIYQFNTRIKELERSLLSIIEKQNTVLKIQNTEIKELKNEVYFLNKKVKRLEEERDDGK